LEAILAAPSTTREILVVDDASLDSSADIAAALGVRVIRHRVNRGAGHARNTGAKHTSSPILVFVDSDVVIHPDALERITDFFATSPEHSAIFGSYDSRPTAGNFVSQYRNLLHHFTHQEGEAEAKTFWAGVGAVKRTAFCSVGGFRSSKAEADDIELGLRLTDAGFRIALDRNLLGTHLKAWHLGSMIKTDLFFRARPWSALILERGGFTNDLNTRRSHRWGVLSAAAFIPMLILSFLSPIFSILSVACVLTNLVSNLGIYDQFYRERGLLFAVAVVPIHFIHQLCAAVGFALAYVQHLFKLSPKKGALLGQVDEMGND
jgi:glycosyltransferase involved in cell wall biosynthesis